MLRYVHDRLSTELRKEHAHVSNCRHTITLESWTSVIQDTKLSLLYGRHETHAMKSTRALWQKYSLEKLSFKDGTGNEHLWTHVVFLRHLTRLFKVLYIYKNGNRLYFKWMNERRLNCIWLYCLLDVFGICMLHARI